MFRTSLLQNTQARRIEQSKGPFSVIEYMKDVSVATPEEAEAAYFSAMMNLRRRQVVADLSKSADGVIIQAGSMFMTIGEVDNRTNIKGAADFIGKLAGSKVTGESAVKPRYFGSGLLVLEPSFKYLLIQEVSAWGGSMVLEDGAFLCCEGSLAQKVVRRTNASSAVLGGEGLFNLSLSGNGYAVLESPVPYSELIVVDLENDVLKIDGSQAVCWSNSLDFTVRKAAKSIAGSIAGGEGLVNVFEGTGRVLIAPVR